MGTITDQKILISRFQDAVTIGKTCADERGWYVCDLDGIHHLYDDGIIRSGAMCGKGTMTAFWPTEEEANTFYEKWVNEGATVCRLCGHKL